MAAPQKRSFGPVPSVLAFLAALLLPACGPVANEPATVQKTTNPHIRFGMPAPADTNPGLREAYLITRPQYVLSYNAEKRTPNWVCWRLRASDIGDVARAAFEPDPDLPESMAHVTSHDYDNSGFDRGHMCPAKDRSDSPEDMAATFYLTNVVPQSPNSNQRGWERLESYCRDLVKDGHVLFIACGPAGAGGTGKNGFREQIGPSHRKVTVPAKLWKVVLVLPGEEAAPRRNSRVIAIIMPNDQTVDYDWTKYRVAPREVEELTGFTFFRDIPPEIAAALREHRDDVEVRVPGEHHGGNRER
jgi:endonuclease G